MDRRLHLTREKIIALPAGRELDALVAEKVLGWRYEPWQGGYEDMHWTPPEGTDDEWLEPALYSTDIAAAWRVVEAMRDRQFHLALDDRGGNPWWAEFAWEGYEHGVQAEAVTPALAICRAALLAILT